MATDDISPVNSRRLFVTDGPSKVRFLIDTGADLCVYPHSILPQRRAQAHYEVAPRMDQR